MKIIGQTIVVNIDMSQEEFEELIRKKNMCGNRKKNNKERKLIHLRKRIEMLKKKQSEEIDPSIQQKIEKKIEFFQNRISYLENEENHSTEENIEKKTEKRKLMKEKKNLFLQNKVEKLNQILNRENLDQKRKERIEKKIQFLNDKIESINCTESKDQDNLKNTTTPKCNNPAPKKRVCREEILLRRKQFLENKLQSVLENYKKPNKDSIIERISFKLEKLNEKIQSSSSEKNQN